MNFQLVSDREKNLLKIEERPQFSIRLYTKESFFCFATTACKPSRRVTMLSQMMHTEDRNLFGIVVVLAARASATVASSLVQVRIRP